MWIRQLAAAGRGSGTLGAVRDAVSPSSGWDCSDTMRGGTLCGACGIPCGVGYHALRGVGHREGWDTVLGWDTMHREGRDTVPGCVGYLLDVGPLDSRGRRLRLARVPVPLHLLRNK